MKFWTIQKRSIVEDYILQGTDYFPNFVHSDYLKENADLSLLYYLVLNGFNKHNNSTYSGLAFSFFKLKDYADGVKRIESFSDYEDFKAWMRANSPAIESLWRRLYNDDTVVLEMEYEENFEPTFIELNDFQLLMPPLMLLPPYTELDIQRICRGINDARLYNPSMSSNIVQGHSPYIKRENIVGIYDMFKI